MKQTKQRKKNGPYMASTEYKLLTILLIFWIFTLWTNAQVTIGSGYEPRNGVLLDLKEDTGGNSTKGLGMPRVNLVNATTLTIANAGEEAGHKGVVVYNIASSAMDGEGLYMWDGNRWTKLGTSGGGAASNTQMAKYEITAIPSSSVPLTPSLNIEWGTVVQEVKIDVTEPGAYTIYTDMVNGVMFSAGGVFETIGTKTIYLNASGNPAVENSNYIFTFAQAGTPGVTSFTRTSNSPGVFFSIYSNAANVGMGGTISVQLSIPLGISVLAADIQWYVNGTIQPHNPPDAIISADGQNIQLMSTTETSMTVYAVVNMSGTLYTTNSIVLTWTDYSGDNFRYKNYLWKRVITGVSPTSVNYKTFAAACKALGPGWGIPREAIAFDYVWHRVNVERAKMVIPALDYDAVPFNLSSVVTVTIYTLTDDATYYVPSKIKAGLSSATQVFPSVGSVGTNNMDCYCVKEIVN